jgi:hypothetical protein
LHQEMPGEKSFHEKRWIYINFKVIMLVLQLQEQMFSFLLLIIGHAILQFFVIMPLCVFYITIYYKIYNSLEGPSL